MCRGDEYWRVGFVEEGLCARRVWSGEGGLLRTEKGKQEIKTEKRVFMHPQCQCTGAHTRMHSLKCTKFANIFA